ncbi:hypothetical protein JCM8547_007634 [Rhodosporidiobolus lusitaniae]
MSTLRRRSTATRSHSSTSLLSSPPSPWTSHSSFPSSHKSPSRRRRSYSLHSSSSSSHQPSSLFEYGSRLLESLDLPASLSGLRAYLLGRMDEAERGLSELREMLEEETEGESEFDGAETTEDEEENDGKRKLRRGRSAETTPSNSRTVSPSRGGEGDEQDAEFFTLEDDLTTLSAFVSSASSFLSALRAELPSLSATSSTDSSSLVALHLSPDARAALDRFLAAHPLPSLPHYGVRARAASGAHAVLARVTTEMDSLRSTMASLVSSTPTPDGQTTPSAFESMSSYFPSAPDYQALKEQFQSDAARFSSAVVHLKDETTSSISHAASDLAHAASDALDEAKRLYHAALEAGKTRLLRYDELPQEWKNNEHVLGGYRFYPIESWPRLLRSSFELHNETINIQSHFWGFVSLAALLVYHLFLSPSSPHSLANAHAGDTAISVLFVLSAMHCLLCSAAWHLLSGCASSSWFRGAACVDYVGISGLIAASVMGAEYYGFYTHPRLAAGYMTMSALVGIMGMLVPFQSWFNKREYKMYRVLFFCSLAASALAPIAHRSVIEGFVGTFWFYSPAIPSVAAYIVGLMFYSNHFPECVCPGSVDIFGASHQWWHVSIVAAIYLHWKAMSDWSTLVALAEVGL